MFCDFIEPTDYLCNLELWTRDNYNILYITGVSGSGKSRLAKELKNKYSCKVIGLDPICNYYMDKSYKFELFKDKNYKEVMDSCPEALDFLKLNFEVKYTYEETMDIMKQFIDWFESKYLHNGELYIVEGYLIHKTMNLEWFFTRPLIVKIIEYRDVVIRRAGRNYKDDLSKISESEIERCMNNARYKESYDSYIDFVDKLKQKVSPYPNG